MAIIVDPDQLDRNQVIFGTTSQELSLYPVGSLVAPEDTDGASHAGEAVFYDMNGAFVASGVAVGDILSIKTGADAGHYIILSGITAVDFTVTMSGTFTGETSLTYDVRQETGGSIADGVTEQTIYSYTKEEWRVDSAQYGSDDLIRHPFPFEPITSEQFEIGGGSPHDNWVWFSSYTRKKIRNGGWSEVDSASQAQFEYAAFRSLGSMDSDAQPYYQQTDTTTTPVDFTFTGAVNEAVQTWDFGGSDFRTYFKAFLRKKGKTYASYDLLTEQGLTDLDYKLFSFPLTHAADIAITNNDNEIEGIAPWSDWGIAVETGSNGVTTGASGTFTSAGQNFQTTVVEGDIIDIEGVGSDNGEYIVLAVPSDTELTLDVVEEFSGSGFNGDTGLSYSIYSKYIAADKTGGDGTVVALADATLADVNGDTGTLVSSTDFAALSIPVLAGDMVLITEAASVHRGVYKVLSVATVTLTLDTTDRAFTAQSTIDFFVVEPGMYLEFKDDAVSLASTGNLTFVAAGPDTIERSSGDWGSDGVTAGTVLTITGTVNNDESYTVAIPGTNICTLVATDSVTAEGPVSGTATAADHFDRTINNVVYAFSWRLFGNDATAVNCYQYIQHQLRQSTDVDNGSGTARGDITDSLMTFAAPTGTTIDMHIDDIANADLNNVTFADATGVSRSYPFVAAGNIIFNANLQSDSNAKYWMYFTNDDAGDNTARDYGTKDAIIVQDDVPANIAGNVSAASSVAFTFDYDNNTQRGSGSDGVDAPVTVVAIGLDTAQFVLVTGTIERTKTNNFTLVSNLERNYSNPS